MLRNDGKSGIGNVLPCKKAAVGSISIVRKIRVAHIRAAVGNVIGISVSTRVEVSESTCLKVGIIKMFFMSTGSNRGNIDNIFLCDNGS